MSTNPTTPVPTTAAAHLAMVEALRALADACDRGADAGVLARSLAQCRAALGGWEKRAPLRDDPAAIGALLEPLEKGGYELLTSEWVAILDALDAALFGTGPRTGGEQGEGGAR